MAKKKIEDQSGPKEGPVFSKDKPEADRSKMMNDRLMSEARKADAKVTVSNGDRNRAISKQKAAPNQETGYYNRGQRQSKETEEQRAPSWLAYRGIKASDMVDKTRTKKTDKQTDNQNEAIVNLRNAYPKEVGISMMRYNSQVTPGKFEYKKK